MSNPYLEAGRLRKAVTLADFLEAKGFSEEMARIMDDGQWRGVAKEAGCNPPNSQETKDMIYERLRRSSDRRQPDFEIQGKEW